MVDIGGKMLTRPVQALLDSESASEAAVFGCDLGVPVCGLGFVPVLFSCNGPESPSCRVNDDFAV